jgi:hypothetical protein
VSRSRSRVVGRRRSERGEFSFELGSSPEAGVGRDVGSRGGTGCVRLEVRSRLGLVTGLLARGWGRRGMGAGGDEVGLGLRENGGSVGREETGSEPEGLSMRSGGRRSLLVGWGRRGAMKGRRPCVSPLVMSLGGRRGGSVGLEGRGEERIRVEGGRVRRSVLEVLLLLLLKDGRRCRGKESSQLRILKATNMCQRYPFLVV